MDPDLLDPLTRLTAERACERVILDFVHHLDLGEPSEVAGLFTQDGVWEWPGGERVVRGRAALGGYFGARPADRLSRRVCTNLRVTLTSAEAATAVTYFTTYRVDGYDDDLGLLPPQAPTQVGYYRDTFRRVDGNWLLARRVLFLTFAGATPNVSAGGGS